MQKRCEPPVHRFRGTSRICYCRKVDTPLPEWRGKRARGPGVNTSRDDLVVYNDTDLPEWKGGNVTFWSDRVPRRR